LLHQRSFVLGCVLFGLVAIVAVCAPLITAADPNRMAVRLRFQEPSLVYLFGTDNLGRSMLSRVCYGGRLSLLTGVGVVALNAVFGVLIGVLAGYVTRFDGPLMRLADALMAFPAVLLAIGVAAALGSGANTVVTALAVVYIPRTARILRGAVLVVRQQEYVEAARAVGVGHARIMWRHILPNCMAPLIVQLSFVFAYAVLSEAVLSFLGLGAPPEVPSWGILIADGRGYIREAPWLTLIPGVAIAMTVLGLNLIGDGLRDALDPRLRIEQT
jgi:peptide/nickel transport system permease protein